MASLREMYDAAREVIAMSDAPGRRVNLKFQFSKRWEYREFTKWLAKLGIKTVEAEMLRTHEQRRDNDQTSCWVTAENEQFAKFIKAWAKQYHGAWMASSEVTK